LKFVGATIGAGPANWIGPAIWVVTVLPGIVAGLAVVLWSIVARPPEAGAART